MTDVRSQRLNSFTSPDTNFHKLWTSPAGMVTLFKGLHIFSPAATGTVVQVFLGSPAGTQNVLSKAFNSGESFTLQPWIAMNPGDWITVSANAAGVQYWLSGAVLLGAPPVVPPTPTVEDPAAYFDAIAAPLG